ncbi:MAG: hypothetical protein N2484_07775 [Clostridia bacterium]|nr:hypothetical protein [Clostridia bacterium]
MRKCLICLKEGNLHRHHVIHGRGKTKACETKESLIDICHDCHKQVHNEESPNLDLKLKLQLQATYFKQGYSEERVCELLGNNLFLVGDQVWGQKED